MGVNGLKNLHNRCGGVHVLQFVPMSRHERAALGLQKKPKQKSHPPNMYILYYQDMYQEYLKSYWSIFYLFLGGRSMRAFAREVSAKWKKLPQAEKDKYKVKYQALRDKQIADEQAYRQQKTQEILAWKAKEAQERKQALLAARKRKALEALAAQNRKARLAQQQQISQILQQLQAAPAPVPQGDPAIQ